MSKRAATIVAGYYEINSSRESFRKIGKVSFSISSKNLINAKNRGDKTGILCYLIVRIFQNEQYKIFTTFIGTTQNSRETTIVDTVRSENCLRFPLNCAISRSLECH